MLKIIAKTIILCLVGNWQGCPGFNNKSDIFSSAIWIMGQNAPSASQQVHKWHQIDRVVITVGGLLLRGILTCRRPKKKLIKFNTDKQNILHLRRNNSTYLCRWGTDWVGSSFAEKDLRVPVVNELYTSQQCTHVAIKAFYIKGCSRKSIYNCQRQVIVPLWKACVRRHLKYCVHSGHS